MQSQKYVEKARNIINSSRAYGTRADIPNMLSLESLNLALAETLAICGTNEEFFDERYEKLLPATRDKLVAEFLTLANSFGVQKSGVDYRKVIQVLKQNEANGGRGAFEPRTVLGESKLIATVLGIISSNGDISSEEIGIYIEENMEQIFQNLMFSLEEF